VTWGRGLESVTPLAPSNPFSVEIDGWGYDLDRARELLAEAGHPNGFEVTLRAIRGINISIGEVIQAQLARIGITVTIQVDEQPTWFSEVFNQRDYQMSVVAHSSKVDPDLSFFDILYTDEAKNYTRLSHPRMDELLLAGRSTTDFDTRKAIYDEVQELIASESGYVVLFVDELLFGVGDHVQDFTLLPTNDIRWWTTSLNR
jgi:peptide/nickel transport system substrate-binding protein